MAERLRKKTWIEAVEVALTNGVSVEKGEMACIDTATGLLTKGQESTTLIPIGYFEQNGTGDGTTKFRVSLFHGVWLHWFDNDSGGTPVVASDLLDVCYILDERTVSGSSASNTRSVAGRVWALDTGWGVGVEMKGFNAGG